MIHGATGIPMKPYILCSYCQESLIQHEPTDSKGLIYISSIELSKVNKSPIYILVYTQNAKKVTLG